MKASLLTGLTAATALTGILATSDIANAAIFTTPLQTANYQQTPFDLNTVPEPFLSQGYGRTDIIDAPLTLQQFNPTLGTFKKVTIGFSGDVVGDGKVENKNQLSKTIAVDLKGDLKLNLDGTSLFDESSVASTTVPNLAPFDGTVDFTGASAGTVSGLQALVPLQQMTYQNPGDLLQFIGTGNLDFLFSASGISTVKGSSNIASEINTFAKAFVTVQYEYEVPDQPPTKVPEPAVTLGLGLVAGLGLLSQKKKILNKI
jgi:hypothetical protein